MVDLSNYSFADWMNFTFGHPVDRKRPWYSGECFLYDFDSKLVLEYLLTFFSHPELGYLFYTPEQTVDLSEFCWIRQFRFVCGGTA